MLGDATYVLPVKWRDDRDLEQLTAYLQWLSRHVDVIVVDGSPSPLFERHAAAWADSVRHIPVDPAHTCRNGKVAGVHTGVAAASTARIVIADDDVRYDVPSLLAVIDRLGTADLVIPQNVFEPRPWHARWDTARSLMNRALGSDYPGTMAFRRSTFIDMGGYDGNALFENLEMTRTVAASGGRVSEAPDVIVTRRPPTARHFALQRVRQAYDSFAQPRRLIGELAILPTLLWLARRSPTAAAAMMLALPTGLCEYGRRKAGMSARLSASASLWGPVWTIERGVCSWIALAARMRGGVRYGDSRVTLAAHSFRWLKARRQVSHRPAAAGVPDACASRRRTA